MCCVSLTSRPLLLLLMAWIRNTDQKILVFDLGGGTFDVSILEIGDGVLKFWLQAVITDWAVTILTRELLTGWLKSSGRKQELT